jgi:hypothetical protein
MCCPCDPSCFQLRRIRLVEGYQFPGLKNKLNIPLLNSLFIVYQTVHYLCSGGVSFGLVWYLLKKAASSNTVYPLFSKR